MLHKGTAADDVRRLADCDWPSAVQMAFDIGLIEAVDIELAFVTGRDVLELCGVTSAGRAVAS